MFQKGKSGNPKGRPKGRTLRECLRRRLSEPDPNRPGQTLYETWVDMLISDIANGNRDLLEVIRFLEGSNPPNVPTEDDCEERLRIIIPGSRPTSPESRHENNGGSGNGKPPA